MSLITPAGTLMAFAGPLSTAVLTRLAQTGWLYCDGKAFPKTALPELFTAIGTNYGSQGANFNVPDFRGRFMRGSDHGTGRDPNAATRTAFAPGGNTGGLPGSQQGFATAGPRNPFVTDTEPDHKHLLPYQPESDHQTAAGASGPAAHEVMAWRSNSGLTTGEAGAHTHTVVAGGDIESRPQNIYVYWFIKFDSTK